MVSALASGLSGQGSSPCKGHYVVFLGRMLYTHSASLTQVYKWVPVNLILQKLEVSTILRGHWAHEDFT